LSIYRSTTSDEATATQARVSIISSANGSFIACLSENLEKLTQVFLQNI
jgi:hypothetical protein